MVQGELNFSGATYSPEFDYSRLKGQIKRIRDLMLDGEWRTLGEIALLTGDGHASISAQLRNLRKEGNGSHIVEKRTRGDRNSGLWEYRLIG